TAQPLRSFTKYTAVRSDLTGTGDWRHVLPLSEDTTMWPRWPTDPSLLPARVTLCSSPLLASGDMTAGWDSTSMNSAAIAGAVPAHAMSTRKRRSMILGSCRNAPAASMREHAAAQGEGLKN